MMSRRGTRFLPPEDMDRVELELICAGCHDRGRREVLDIWRVETVKGKYPHRSHTSAPPRCEETMLAGDRWHYTYRCEKHTPVRNTQYSSETIDRALELMRTTGMSRSTVPI